MGSTRMCLKKPLDRVLWVCVCVCVCVLSVGCSEEEEKKGGGGSLGTFDLLGGDTSGGDGTSVTDDATSADGTDGADGTSSGAVLEIVSPLDAQSLASDQLVTQVRFTARCRAGLSDGSVQVDAGSVAMEVEAADGTLIKEETRTTSIANEYAADFDMTGFSNGPLTVRCAAFEKGADLDGEPTWTDSTATFLDLGPTITIASPNPGGAYGQVVNLDITVAPAPVSEDDPQSAVSDVTIMIAGKVLPDDMLTVVGEGHFQGTVRFDDPLFDPALFDENTLTVRASNNRPPAPVTAEQSLTFIADSTGPTIAIVSPLSGDLVGGLFKVQAEITDQGQINNDTVVATIAQTVQTRLRYVSGNLYEGQFDSRTLSRDWVFPLLEVRAQDAAGNQASVGFQVTLDARPPFAHLDPNDVREARVDNGRLECSERFDPVGIDALEDGETTPQLSKLRARIQDRGNGGISNSGGIVIPIGGVDNSEVRLFVLDDSSGALVVDTNGDGFCDAINPLIVPTSVPDASNEAAVLNMTPLDPDGLSFFDPTIQASEFGVDPLIPDGSCNPGDATTAPDPVCPVVSPLRRIISGVDDLPLIYTLPPTDDARCLGNAFDALASNLSEGWTCLAIEIHDTLGNVGVSAPMRLCIDTNGDGSDGCLAWSQFGRVINPESSRPNCTGTFNPSSNTIDTSTPCVFRPEEDFLDPINAPLNLLRIDLD